MDESRTAGVPVVGIGASAGGLRALQSFFDHIPVETGLAFVVIVHLDPDHESQMAQLLRSHTALRVDQVSQAVRVEADHVYIIPPDRDLSLDDGYLRLSDRQAAPGRRAPIDFFFRTLAETHATNAVGIILSGTGTDGTQGIRWVKERGGVTMAQAPAEADHDGMPLSAISTGQVDLTLPVAALASELVRIRRAGARIRLATGERLEEIDSAALATVLAHVRRETGYDFTSYKGSTVLRRLRRRMQFTGAETLADYARTLHEDSKEIVALIDDLLITVTSFFRDGEAFDALAAAVIPALFAHRSDQDEVRVWVPGCATGEEAYSLAILLSEHADRTAQPPRIQVFATDASEHACTFAREGVYPESIAADVSGPRLERFFVKEPSGYRVKKTVREMVLFANHDVLRDPPFLRLDLISCRNLLIYLERGAQRRILDLFHYALLPSGRLFLGSSESADAATELFTVVDKKHHIFQSVGIPRALTPRTGSPLTMPALPLGAGWHGAPATISFATLHHRMLEAYAPPSLIVDAHEEVVHLSEGVGRFLRLGGGEPTRRLLDMVAGDLRLELRTLLHMALVRGTPAAVHAVPMVLDGSERVVDVTVRPLHGEQRAGNFALVIFDEKAAAPSELAASSGDPAPTHRSDRTLLERELREVKAQLQATSEEHEATIEELRASNEELQSINEEQRATSEELETSREELQSINEELRTVNQEHRSKNEELLQVNSDLHNLIDSTDIGTIFLDRDFRIRRFTPPTTKIFNFVATDAGRPITHVTHELDYPNLVEDARRALRTLRRTEREVRTRDGRWFVVRISPYRALDDRIDGVVLTFFDSTDRNRLIEREALLQETREASGAKSRFISVMSHEFRTPLNAIIGYADLLSSAIADPVSDRQQNYLDRIRASAMHLAHMIDEVLVFSRIEAGHVVAEPGRVDLVDLLREAAAMMEPTIAVKDLAMQVDVPNAPLVVLSDHGKLRQIVLNLLSNAVRYTDRGRIDLRLRSTKTAAIIEVEDTGIGIAAEHLERIFERFWQVDQSTTATRGGTGLGLTVSRSIARMLGGDIEVESEPGRGSLFRVRLPRGEESTLDLRPEHDPDPGKPP